MSTILHLVRAQHRPAPIELDAAARLASADCAVIAGDCKRMSRASKWLIWISIYAVLMTFVWITD